MENSTKNFKFSLLFVRDVLIVIKGESLVQWKAGVCFGLWRDYDSWRADSKCCSPPYLQPDSGLIVGRVPLPGPWLSAWPADLLCPTMCRRVLPCVDRYEWEPFPNLDPRRPHVFLLALSHLRLEKAFPNLGPKWDTWNRAESQDPPSFAQLPVVWALPSNCRSSKITISVKATERCGTANEYRKYPHCFQN